MSDTEIPQEIQHVSVRVRTPLVHRDATPETVTQCARPLSPPRMSSTPPTTPLITPVPVSMEPKGRIMALHSPHDALREEALRQEELKRAEMQIMLRDPWDFKRTEEFLDTQYNSDNSNKSVICDIIAMYLKGQKTLYTEAKTVCEQRMNYLMLPAIFVTSACTILSLVLKEYDYGATVVSALNGFNAFLLALISYLKLDAKAEAHRTSAYKFDKLQSQLEFSSGKSMFMKITYDDMVKMINDAEANVREIKETNKFILPEDIRYRYPKMCNTNVFAEVKRVQNTEMQMTNTLTNVLNEQNWFRRKAHERELTEEEQEKRKALKERELSIVHEIISLKDDYLHIDEQFEKEMATQRNRAGQRFQLCGCLKT